VGTGGGEIYELTTKVRNYYDYLSFIF